ncbi:MAG: hypothetical protein IIA45_12190 [Bacteroidetes bacterium]|nr:hypothetical protein [Bacteroidota bacterium]
MPATGQSFLQINSTITSDIYQVESLENNDLIISGTYKGKAEFGSFSRLSKDKASYVARVNTSGQFLWVTELDVVITDLAVTSKGICVLSIYKEKNKVDRTSSLEMKLTKLNLEGKKKSVKSICKFTGDLYDLHMQGILDNNAHPMACLIWVKDKTTKIDSETLSKKKYGAICYIQYDQEGNEKWRQHTEGGFNSFTDMHLEAMSFDKDNNFYAIGGYGEEAFYGSTKLITNLVYAPNFGAIDFYYKGSYLMKLSPEGKLEKVIALSKYQCKYTSIAFGEDGIMFVAGYYKGNNKEQLRKMDGTPSQPAPEIGAKVLPGSRKNQEASFLAKLSSDWNTEWTYVLESDRGNRVSSITVGNNRLAVTGFWVMNLFDGKNSFKSVENTSPYKSEVYQQLFDLDGNHLTTIVYQGKGSEWPKHIINKSNQIVCFGNFREEMNIGKSKYTSKGTYQNAFMILPKKLDGSISK